MSTSLSSSYNGDSINERKQIVIKNPDGIFMHCPKLSLNKENFNNSKKGSNFNQEEKEEEEESNELDKLTITDTALDYMVENYETFGSNNLLSDFLSSVKANLVVLILLLIFDLSLCVLLCYNSWKKKEYSLEIITRFYSALSIDKAMLIFYLTLAFSILISCAFYSFATFTICKQNIKCFKIFSYFCLVTGVLDVLAVYLDVFFFGQFLLRIVMYSMGKYISNLLISVIVLPKKMQGKDFDYDTIDGY